MEQIVAKLVMPDNRIIQEGTIELKEAFKDPNSISALFDVLISSAQSELRQTAAVLLRRRFSKRNVWMKIDDPVRTRIRKGTMDALINEKVSSVKNSIAHLIAILGKHEINSACWSEIFHFIIRCCNSENVTERELGMYVISILTEESAESYFSYFDQFLLIFNNILGSLTVLRCDLAYYVVITLKNFVSKSNGNQQMVNLYHNTLPRVLEIISAFAAEGEDEIKRTSDMLELIEELVEFVPTALLPHIHLTTNVCLTIAISQTSDPDVKNKAINALSFFIEAKSKVMLKENLIEPIVDAMMTVMSLNPDVEEDEIELNSDELVPVTAAAKTLDIISLNLPPEKIIPLFLNRVDICIQHNDPYRQKAGYLALAVIVEGCSDYIRKKYIESCLKCVYNGINNPIVTVRNAALFAFGQFSEHLQPEISNYASDVLPLLLKNLTEIHSQVQLGQLKATSLDRLFYALETFCENLNSNLEPFVPALMEQLFLMLNPEYVYIPIKKMCFNTIGAVATAVKEAILPYFSRILVMIDLYMSAESTSHNVHAVCDALDCLSILAVTIGNENFKPVAEDALKLALRILNAECYDADNNRAAYAVIGALAIVMKNDFAPVVPTVVEKMIRSLQNCTELDEKISEEIRGLINVYDTPDNDLDEEEDIGSESTLSESSNEELYIQNKAFIEEKEQICKTLNNISANVREAFLPYLENCFMEVFKTLTEDESGIQNASLEALQQFCITLHNSNLPNGKQSLHSALQMLIPKCSELIRLETDREVVMTALNVYENLLREIKEEVLVGEGHKEAIMNCIIDVYNLKTTCQEPDADADEESDSEQAELLVEHAGEIIPQFGKAMKPSEFFLYFPNVLMLLSKRTNKKRSESQRSFSYGILAECMQALEDHLDRFVLNLIKIWSTGIRDESWEARSNSVYGLGELVYYGKTSVFPYYSEILQLLSSLSAMETQDRIIDNICSVIAKLITVNSALVPLEQVFSSFMDRLPLKKDFQENMAIVRCFYALYQQGNSVLKQHLPKVIQVVVHLYCYQCNENTDAIGLSEQFLKIVNNDFNEEFSKSLISLEPASAEKLHKLLSS